MSFVPLSEAAITDEVVKELKLPRKIYVSGASIFLAGYNGEYSLQPGQAATYRRPEHFLCGVFISPSFIEHVDGEWILCRKDPYRTRFYSNGNLLGRWSTGITVCEQPRPLLDALNSYGIVAFCSLAAMSFALFAATRIVPRAVEFVTVHANDPVPLWLVALGVFASHLFVAKIFF